MFFDNLPKLEKVKPYTIKREELRLFDYKPTEKKRPTEPWPLGDEVIFDVELYPNFFFVGFKHIASQTYMNIDVAHLGYMMWAYKIIGFNSLKYDIPIIEAAVKGKTIAELKRLSDEIILEDKRVRNSQKYNHIDIIEVAPLSESLKTYAGRLHCERMQDLPFDPNEPLSDDQKALIADYCFNDLDNTELLYNELRPHIALREKLGSEYGEDLRSKSDAQIAEVVISTEIQKLTGYPIRKPKLKEDFSFRYKRPEWLSFSTVQLQAALATVEDAIFRLDKGGSPQLPPSVAALSVAIGQSVYKMGNGGLHSTEKSICHIAADETLLLDRDVASYYPAIILNQELYPKHIGRSFLKVFEKLVKKRLEAKGKDKVTADALKITINGTFGKLGSPHSRLYAPDLLIQTTITGQLALLMLIELLEESGVSVISANTDGLIIKCAKSEKSKVEQLVGTWENITGFFTEETQYKAVYSRDVNNYLAIKTNGETKAKGVFSEKGSALNSVLSKNPETLVVNDAIEKFLSLGRSLSDTICSCEDMRRFVSVRKATGGAHKNGVYLGKVVRWYYAKGETGTINKLKGDSVPKTEGAKPLMQLGGLEPDIDYDWYINTAEQVLHDIGFYKKQERRKLI